MRDDYLTLVDRFTDDYPHLVISMTGPWKAMREGILEEEEQPWICNFRNLTLGSRQVHSGSRGDTMYDALRAGIEYLEANPGCAPDQSVPLQPTIARSP